MSWGSYVKLGICMISLGVVLSLLAYWNSPRKVDTELRGR